MLFFVVFVLREIYLHIKLKQQSAVSVTSITPVVADQIVQGRFCVRGFTFLLETLLLWFYSQSSYTHERQQHLLCKG